MLFNAERRSAPTSTVVRLEGWRRDQWFDHTGLAWVNPSPNMRNLTQATLYPGIGAIEYANISVGRGTDQPFEQIGAPWIDGPRLAAALNARELPGIRFYPVHVHAGVERAREPGVPGRVHGGDQPRGAAAGARRARDRRGAVAAARRPVRQEDVGAARGVGGGLARARAGEDPAAIAASWAGAEAAWRRLRAKYLLVSLTGTVAFA